MNKSFIAPSEIKSDGVFSKHHQVYTQLKKELHFGDFEAGDRFHSIRNLRDLYKMNAQTIRVAIDRLVAEGFLTNKPASGLYVNGAAQRDDRLSMGNVWFCQLSRRPHHNPFYDGTLEAIQRRATARRVKVIVNRNVDLDGFDAWYAPETGDGVVLMGTINHDVINEFKKRNVQRYVVVGNHDLPEGTPNIRFKLTDVVYRSLRVAADNGRRKLGVIANHLWNRSAREIIAGVSQAVNEGLIECVGGYFSFPEDGITGMRTLSASGMDCVLVTELAYLGFCRHVIESGIKCPDDLFVIRYGRNEEDNVFGDIASVSTTSNRDIVADALLDTLFENGPAIREFDVEIKTK